MTCGEYLKSLRKNHGLTIYDVMRMSGGKVDKTTISRIERDERKPALLAAYVFSEVYGVDMKEIVYKLHGKVKIKK
jgi:transcriptional regulator with XRE-family HTH domain